MNEKINIQNWTCPMPLRNYPNIMMGHGAGGKMMNDLIKHLFAPLFDSPTLEQFGDSAVLDIIETGKKGQRLAFSTDSFVVSPLIFPGGNIGELAVNGTINDLAMSGAQPLFLSAGFILEEGLPMDTLGEIVSSAAAACQAAGVEIVTGDTKVVNKGHGDGLYINTTGIGLIPPGIEIAPHKAQAGDSVIVSGTVGDHGMAILSMREGLEFETQIKSDTASLHDIVQSILNVTKDIHCLRDATRGGLAAALNELAVGSNQGIIIEEMLVPIRPAVRAACEMLGLDALIVANEGKFVAIAPKEHTDAILAVMQAHPLGQEAIQIGEVSPEHPGTVVAQTEIGGTRIVDLPLGELLPRIC